MNSGVQEVKVLRSIRVQDFSGWTLLRRIHHPSLTEKGPAERWGLLNSHRELFHRSNRFRTAE